MVTFDGNTFQVQHNAGLITAIQVDACMVAGHTVAYLKAVDEDIGFLVNMNGPALLFSDTGYYCNRRFVNMKHGSVESER